MPRSIVTVDDATLLFPTDVATANGTGAAATVFFGSDENTARPASTAPVVWVGYTGVVPVNAEDNDLVFTSDAPSGDTTPPVAGTLTASNITDTGFTLTVTGASDETALNATPYAFTIDGGGIWTPYQASAVYSPSGLTPDTGYTCQHRVRDAADNVSTGASQVVTTAAEPLPDPPAFADAIAIFDARDVAGVGHGNAVTSWPARQGAYTLTPAGTGGCTYQLSGARHMVKTTATSYLTTGDGSMVLAQPDSIMAVTNFPNGRNGGAALASNSVGHTLGPTPSQYIGLFAGTADQRMTPQTEWPASTAIVTGGVFDGASSIAYIDGVSGPVGNPGANGRNSLRVGTTTTATPIVVTEVSWVAIGDRTLTLTEMNDIRTWLQAEGVAP